MVVAGGRFTSSDPLALADRSNQLNDLAGQLIALSHNVEVLRGMARVRQVEGVAAALPKELLDTVVPVGQGQHEAARVRRAYQHFEARLQGFEDCLEVARKRSLVMSERLRQLAAMFSGAEERVHTIFESANLPWPIQVIADCLKSDKGRYGALYTAAMMTWAGVAKDPQMMGQAFNTMSGYLNHWWAEIPAIFAVRNTREAVVAADWLVGKITKRSVLGSWDEWHNDTRQTQQAGRQLSAWRAWLFGDAGMQGVKTRITHVTNAKGKYEVVPRQLSDMTRLMSDLDERMTDGTDRINHGQIFLLKHRTKSGVSWTVMVPGTQDWWPFSRTPQNIDTNMRAVGRQATTQTAAVLAAMERAGVKPGDPVELMGHSQGAGTVMQLLASPAVRAKYNIRYSTDIGGPATVERMPSGVHSLSVRETRDIVTAMGGAQVPSSVDHLVVAAQVPASRHFHMKDSYQFALERIDRSDDPNLLEYRDGRRQFLGLDDPHATSELVEVETSRAPGKLPDSVDDQVAHPEAGA